MGRIAIRYEEKLENGKESELARKCQEEMKRRAIRKKSDWEEERKKFYQQRGIPTIEE